MMQWGPTLALGLKKGSNNRVEIDSILWNSHLQNYFQRHQYFHLKKTRIEFSVLNKKKEDNMCVGHVHFWMQECVL